MDTGIRATYTAWAGNEAGASTDVNGGKRFVSINAAMIAARNEFGRGWRIHIVDADGQTVKEFTIRG
jgi:hypothetical protein